MAGLWEQVLEVRNVSGSSNFFELGGHSLKAAVLMNHVTDHLGVELPLSALDFSLVAPRPGDPVPETYPEY